jgi:hypothetical protein
LAIKFGTCAAIVKAEAAAEVPKKLAATISRPSPAILDKPVEIAKMTVFRAMRRRGGEGEEVPGAGRVETFVDIVKGG